jgi:hypothetical protein
MDVWGTYDTLVIPLHRVITLQKTTWLGETDRCITSIVRGRLHIHGCAKWKGCMSLPTCNNSTMASPNDGKNPPSGNPTLPAPYIHSSFALWSGDVAHHVHICPNLHFRQALNRRQGLETTCAHLKRSVSMRKYNVAMQEQEARVTPYPIVWATQAENLFLPYQA